MKTTSIDATNAADIIEQIIGAYCIDQDDFDAVITKIADNNADELLTWIKENIMIKTPDELPQEECELEWA
ncbi:MAG: hypothetical protein ACTSWQ_03190 [Candidatus Thorarchaeota archaeon]